MSYTKRDLQCPLKGWNNGSGLHSACCANMRIYVYSPNTHRNMCPPGGDHRAASLDNLWAPGLRRITEVDIPMLTFSFHTHSPKTRHAKPTHKEFTGTSSYSPHAVSRERTLEFKGNQNYTVGVWGQPELTVSRGNALKNFWAFLLEKRIHAVGSGMITSQVTSVTNLLCWLLSAVKNLPCQPIAATGNVPANIKLPSDRVPHDSTCDISCHFCDRALQFTQHGLHGCGSWWFKFPRNTKGDGKTEWFLLDLGTHS